MNLLPQGIEKDISDRIRRGDSAAMKSLYDLMQPYLDGVCSRYLNDDDDVKDALQEVFIKIFSEFGKFKYRGQGSLQAWTKRIAVNEALMRLRSRKRSRLVPLDEREVDGDCDEGAEIEDISAEDLLGFIRLLPEQYRTVFNLYILDDMSHKEIASVLGISESTSASNLHRAKKLLTQMILSYRQAKDYD